DRSGPQAGAAHASPSFLVANAKKEAIGIPDRFFRKDMAYLATFAIFRKTRWRRMSVVLALRVRNVVTRSVTTRLPERLPVAAVAVSRWRRRRRRHWRLRRTRSKTARAGASRGPARITRPAARSTRADAARFTGATAREERF